MTAFLNHFAFEFRSGLRNANQLLMNYLFPLSFYAMMGLIMTQINPLFQANMVPAMVVFSVMASAVLGLPSPLVESREAGIYRSYKINGVPALSILAIPGLTTMFHNLIVAAMISLTAEPFFAGVAPVHWGSFALITLLTAFTHTALGALIGVIAANTRATVFLSQIIFLPACLLSGLMMPAEFLPDSVRRLSALLPPTHAMQAFLGLAYGQETVLNPVYSAIILLTGGLLAFGLAIYLFNWDRQNSARRGHPLLAILALVPYVVGTFIA
jgi:ABC-2 type transport system permease protein